MRQERLEKLIDDLLGKHEPDLEISVKVADMKRSAGRYNPSKKEIKLSKHLLENHSENVLRTVKHELGHAIADHRNERKVKPHGREWRKIMSELGVEDPSACHKMQLTDYKYIVRCSDPDCDVKFGRYRKSKTVKHAEKYVCKECGSSFESFKLKD